MRWYERRRAQRSPASGRSWPAALLVAAAEGNKVCAGHAATHHSPCRLVGRIVATLTPPRRCQIAAALPSTGHSVATRPHSSGAHAGPARSAPDERKPRSAIIHISFLSTRVRWTVIVRWPAGHRGRSRAGPELAMARAPVRNSCCNTTASTRQGQLAHHCIDSGIKLPLYLDVRTERRPARLPGAVLELCGAFQQCDAHAAAARTCANRQKPRQTTTYNFPTLELQVTCSQCT
jgi:hypothetical protein